MPPKLLSSSLLSAVTTGIHRHVCHCHSFSFNKQHKKMKSTNKTTAKLLNHRNKTRIKSSKQRLERRLNVRALAVSAEEHGWVPSTHRTSSNLIGIALIPVPEEPTPCWVPGTHSQAGTYIHICRRTLTFFFF